MTTTATSKDSQLAEIIARMEARDEARDAQIRMKDKQSSELIDKLISMSTTGTNNTRMDEEDTYRAVVGSTAKKTRFESAQSTTKGSQDDLRERAKEEKTNNNDRIQAYLGSFAEAAAAKEERIQEMTTAASSKDSQLAEIIARMEARDEARDAQIRMKEKQIGELIDKLTSMSTTGTYNNDRNNKRDRDEGGDGGGGGGGGSRTDKGSSGKRGTHPGDDDRGFVKRHPTGRNHC